MFINVGGVPGVGKTTITKEVEKLARKEGYPLERISGLPILLELSGARTAEELRALPENLRHELRPEMYRRLYESDKRDPNTIRLGDGHFCMFDVDGKEYGVREIQPGDNEQMLAFVVLTTKPESILRRRIAEQQNRGDRQLNIDFIITEQRLEIEIARKQALELGIPFIELHNDDEQERFSFGREKMSYSRETEKGERASAELFQQIKNLTQGRMR